MGGFSIFYIPNFLMKKAEFVGILWNGLDKAEIYWSVMRFMKSAVRHERGEVLENV